MKNSGFVYRPLTDVDSSVYQMDGSGYVQLPQVRFYKNDVYEVSLQFKTFWHEALLFFTSNDQKVHCIMH